MKGWSGNGLGAAAFGLSAALAAAATIASPTQAQIPDLLPPALQSNDEALAQDAGQYARQYGVSLEEALSRLRAQQASVEATDRLQERFGRRLAGITIEHRPDYRIVVLLTGDEPVAPMSIEAAGRRIPVVFLTGAPATREQVVLAMRQHQPLLRARLPGARGMGLDPRTGELVLFVSARDAARFGQDRLKHEAQQVARVPVRIEISDTVSRDLAVGGGARVSGIDPSTGRRFGCTTGFVVTDGAKTGIITAAHCPDSLVSQDEQGEEIPLAFVGQWGARYQDVQVHLSGRAQQPIFYADRSAGALRPLTSWRNRRSTRAGDVVCHWGESSGYSCSEVELTDFAPGGDLCGGACDPVWTTVRGPSCKRGDSGGPVFSGTIAFGILKGGNYGPQQSCSFYYYMSVDYLPEGWTLLHQRR